MSGQSAVVGSHGALHWLLDWFSLAVLFCKKREHLISSVIRPPSCHNGNMMLATCVSCKATVHTGTRQQHNSFNIVECGLKSYEDREGLVTTG
jgi:hypothetical protein